MATLTDTNNIFITTPIYYANGDIHIGHFLTTLYGSFIASYYTEKYGKANVFFTSGIDEHGTSVEQAAKKAGYTPDRFQEYVDTITTRWQAAFLEAGLTFDYFARTTANKHQTFVQDFIVKLQQANAIYKGEYVGKYCTGCEKFLTKSDLTATGLCPQHRADQVIETIETNYFFKLSTYQEQIKSKIKTGALAIFPESKKNEILARLDTKLDDVSISRPASKVAWGIPFPGDPEQVVYVWVDALLNYLSSLHINAKNEFWPNTIHIVGKDIQWFHNVIWPGLLLAAGYEPQKTTLVHSFINIAGQKVSKSLGNVITPTELIARYGCDGAKYLVLTHFPYKDDVDITWELLDQKYNADLANGLGNIVARLTTLAQTITTPFKLVGLPAQEEQALKTRLTAQFDQDFRVDSYISGVWDQLALLDKAITETAPWTIKNEGDLKQVLENQLNTLYTLTKLSVFFLPDTAQKILVGLNQERIVKLGQLFPRLSI